MLTEHGQAAEKGSAFVTMKQVREGDELTCLVRCRYQDHKSSTVVRGKDLVRFQTRLAATLKAAWGTALPKKASKRATRGGAKASDAKRAKD